MSRKLRLEGEEIASRLYKRPLHNSVSLEKTCHFEEILHSSEPSYAGRPIEDEQESEDREMAVFNKENQLCRGLSKVCSSLGTFFFPTRCVHCDEVVDHAARFLCDGCVTALPWLDSTMRCNGCFLEQCRCRALKGCLDFRLAAFAHIGPAASLIHQLKFRGREEIATVLASSIFFQLEKQKHFWPDFIVPVPHTPWHSLLRGYRPAELIARELGKLMKIPVKKLLKRSLISLPQRCKTKEQRENLAKEIYQLQRHIDCVDRSILLVDDVTTTGMTLIRCAEALRNGFPRRIIGCTVTLAEKD